ncbi:MAG: ComEC/Rec2 family competence protein [Candidatus Shapirobacteria bacterium]|nr:ComEC/Rec2 family competence protein [Candidatus Shapirobacteria bacterium]
MAYFWQNKKLEKESRAGPSSFLGGYLFLLIIFLLIWSWRFNSVMRDRKEPGKSSEQVAVEGIIWEEPRIFYSTQNFWLKGYQIETLSDHSLGVGDRVALVGKATCQPIGRFQENCLIHYPEISIKKNDCWSEFIKVVVRLRKKLIVSLERVLPSEAASLLTGIVWGNQGQFSKTFYQDMKNSGLLHVVVASGANVMSLVGLLKKGTLFLGRRLSILITLPVVILYGLVVGTEPPIVRAVIMSGFLLVSQLFGRQASPLRSLFLTGGTMMLFDPLLFADISFQLSFGATLGILLFSRKLKNLLGWSDLATTLSAQTVTLPILALHFGQLSPLSFLSNAFLLWLVEPLMLWGLLLTFLGLINRFLASLIGFFLWLPLQVFIWGGHFWAQILPNIGVSLVLAVSSFALAPLLWLLLSSVKDDK